MKTEISKRIVIVIAMLALCVPMVLTGCKEPAAEKISLDFPNESFYDADGKFNEDAAKNAYITVMKYHGYPVFDDIKEKLWVSDYGTGQFAKLGLGANMFQNNEEDRYMLMDLFILPGQMLPEHWHLESTKNPAKREGWLLRHGKSYIVGIGEDNLADFSEVIIPQCHMDGKATTNHVIPTTPGQFVKLAQVKSRHWQFAGIEGAIITEVANVHTGPSVRHSDKKINDHFLAN
jgi:D-lyxose ketol-isomerase